MIPTPNLIPQSVLERRSAARWRSRWTWIAGVAAIIAGVVAGTMRAGAEGGLGEQRAELARLEARDDEVRQRLPGLKAEAEKAKRVAGAATVLSERPDWSLLLGALAEMSEPGVALKSVKVEPLDASGQAAPPAAAVSIRVSVSGFSERQSDVQTFVLTLERSGLFDRTTLLGTRPSKLPNADVVAFDVECTIGSGAIAGEGS